MDRWRHALFALLLIGGCAPPIEGEVRKGIIFDHFPALFVGDDGTLYPLGFGWTEAPACVEVDSSIVEPDTAVGGQTLTIHRILRQRPYNSTDGGTNCDLQAARLYRGLYYVPTEGEYFFASPGAVDRADGGWGWAIVDVSTVRVRLNTEELQAHRRACLEVIGVRSQRGRFNHLGSSAYSLTVLQVVRAFPVPEVPPQTDLRLGEYPPLVRAEEVAACIATR
jgi:hypothetical protein